MLVAVTVPLCVLLGVLSEPLIRVVYGDQWVGGATVLKWLAALALLRVTYQLFSDFFVATGRNRLVLSIQSLWLVFLVPALSLAVHLLGMVGAGVGHVAVAAVVIGPTSALALHSAGVPLRPLIAAVDRPVLAGAASIVAGLGAVHVVSGALPQLLLGVPVILLVYVPLAHPMRDYRAWLKRSVEARRTSSS